MAGQSRDTIHGLNEPTAIDIPNQAEDIALCLRQRIEPATPVVNDDDDFAVSAILGRPPRALLDVDCVTSLGKDRGAWHTIS